MIREIKKKMVVLHNRTPFPADVKSYINELELKEWVYMNLRLSGSGLSREDLDTIFNGGCVLEARIEDHLMVERLRELRSYIYQLTDMESQLSLTVIKDMERIITGGNDSMADDMGEVVALYRTQEEFPDHFMKAAKLHNRLIEICRYEEGCEYLARAVMHYYLVEQGFPLAAINMSEQEYNDSIVTYLKTGDSRTLQHALMRAVFNRLDLMLRLTDN